MDALKRVSQSDGYFGHLETEYLFLDVPPDTTTICGVFESIRNGGVPPSKVAVRFVQWDGAPRGVGLNRRKSERGWQFPPLLVLRHIFNNLCSADRARKVVVRVVGAPALPHPPIPRAPVAHNEE
jgi:hypothetical protein